MSKKNKEKKADPVPPVVGDDFLNNLEQSFNHCKMAPPRAPEPNALDEVKAAFYRYQQAKVYVADVERMLNGAKDAMAVTEREYKARAKSLLEEIHESLRK